MLKAFIALITTLSFAANRCEIKTSTIFQSNHYQKPLTIYLDAPHAQKNSPVGKLFYLLYVVQTDFAPAHAYEIIRHRYTIVNEDTQESYNISENIHVYQCQVKQVDIDLDPKIEGQSQYYGKSLETVYDLSQLQNEETTVQEDVEETAPAA